ncbi:MAG: hypothetical protein LQ343_005135 [Gyalolechia ehrenbergii]|nr:MAG: hypothetical protein LQ343_005135 [Gyalolechia ehrenbergii]
MEGIAGAASIAAVLEVTAKLGKLCGSYIHEVRQAQNDIERLRSKVLALEAVLVRLQKLPPSEIDATAILNCCEYLDPVKKRLESKMEHSTMRRMGFRALKWPFTSKDVGAQVQRIEEYLAIFNTILQLNISAKTTNAEQDRLMDKLVYVGEAILTSYETSRRHRQCLPSTRVDVLEQIMKWTADTSPRCIFWLKGLAGTGKSTIATTIASRLKAKSSHLATYFFERGHSDLAHVRKLVPTIVRQLSGFSPSYRQSVLDAIKRDPNIGQSADLREQYETLLLGPLRLARPLEPSKEPFIIIMDALDECDDEIDLRMLLNLFATTNDLPELRIKIFVSSRPDLSRHGFEEMPSIFHHTMILQDVPREVVDRDIKIYLSHELRVIQERFRLPAQWPSMEEQKTLATKAGGLFIFAATACRFIGGASQAKPQDRLKQICSSVTTNKLMTEELDQMYALVLQSSIKGRYTDEEQESNRVRFRHIVGSIVILLDPLPISQLFTMLGGSHVESQEEFQGVLQTLQSVIDVPEDAYNPVQPLHLSFRDFLLDPDRCCDRQFWVDEEQANQTLALDCLRLMSSSLRRNMCGIPSSGTLKAEVDPTVIEDTFSPAVQYACRHWGDHAVRGNLVKNDHGSVHKFLQNHLLHWLECMSVIGRISEAIAALINLASMAEVGDLSAMIYLVLTASSQFQQSSLVYDFIHDCRRFALHFRNVIEQAPQQLYTSALLFSPLQSSVRQSFTSNVPRWVRLRPQVHETWGPSLQTIECSYNITSARFLQGDRLLATSGFFYDYGNKQELIDIWYAQTGERETNLIPVTRDPKIIKLSPDGLILILVSYDGVLKLWDIAKRAYRFSMEKRRGEVVCTELSGDNNFLAVGYDDGTIQLLGTEAGDLRNELRGHSNYIIGLKFSPDSKIIATSAEKEVLRLWNVQKGSLLLTIKASFLLTIEDGLLTGKTPHFRTPNSLMAFSPDGKLLAVVVESAAIQVWDLAIGKVGLNLEKTAENPGQIPLQIVFSPDSEVLASLLREETIQLWDMRTGACFSILTGSDVVAFSPDGELLASGSSNYQLRVWNMQKDELHCTLDRHTLPVTTLNFSEDGRNLVSGSYDDTARVWDIQRIARHPSPEHEGQELDELVYHVNFSNKGKRVVSLSNCMISIWNFETGDCLSQHHGWDHSISSDGQLVMLTSEDGRRVVDVQTGNPGNLPNGNLHTLSPDGQLAAFVDKKNAIRIWNIRRDEEVTGFDHTCKDIERFFFSSDNVLIASQSKEEVRIWSIQTGQCVSTVDYPGLPGPLIEMMTFSPNNEILAFHFYRDAHSFYIWDIRAGYMRFGLSLDRESISEIVFGPDNRLVVGVTWRRGVVVWNTQTGERILTEQSHSRTPRIDFLAGTEAVFIDGKPYPTGSTKVAEAEVARYRRSFSSLQIDESRKWVTRSSERLLWLPPERRPGPYAVWGIK